MGANTLLVEIRAAGQSTTSSRHDLDRLIDDLIGHGFTISQSPMSKQGATVNVAIACPASDSVMTNLIVPILKRYNRSTGNSGLLIRFYSVSVTSPKENIAIALASDKSQYLGRLEATIQWMLDIARKNPPPLDNWR